jgi:hypothetical protein
MGGVVRVGIPTFPLGYISRGRVAAVLSNKQQRDSDVVFDLRTYSSV